MENCIKILNEFLEYESTDFSSLSKGEREELNQVKNLVYKVSKHFEKLDAEKENLESLRFCEKHMKELVEAFPQVTYKIVEEKVEENNISYSYFYCYVENKKYNPVDVENKISKMICKDFNSFHNIFIELK